MRLWFRARPSVDCEAMWTTRAALPADFEAVSRLFSELGVPEAGPDEARFVGHMLPRVVVACDGDEVVGYASWRIYGRTAHVVNVAVDPAVRGRGAGRALMDAVRERIVTGAGCSRWYLNVKRDNEPAIRLYEGCGLAIEREVWALRIDWAKVDALAGERATTTLVPGDVDEAAIAARFGLLRERLAHLRARAGMAVVALRDASGELVAYAAFDPQHPGAAVFCVARVALARPLFEACRAHADLAAFDFLRVTIDRDPALKDALVAAGADVTFELLLMGAALDG